MSDTEPLNSDVLVEKATTQSGFPDRGDTYKEGLERFIADFNRSETVNQQGREFAKNWVVEHLSARFALEEWIFQHPEVLHKPVRAPVFILGLPRAGTTLLLNLLALDPQHRPYWHWEANREVPPVEAEQLNDDTRIARKVAEVNAGLESGALDHRHHVEMGDEPCECVWLLAQDFKAYPWLVLTGVPNYLEWLLDGADLAAAYRHHKRALQVMQSRAPGQWLLKYPSHAPFVDAILSVYPEARIVVTHRDPVKPLGSSCSATHHIMAPFNDGEVGSVVGAQTLRIIEESLRGICNLSARHPYTPVYDLHYREFVADPMAEVRRLYDFMGEELFPEVAQRMEKALREHEALRRRVGKHHYQLADYGLSREALPEIFREYMERFDIEREAG